MLARGEEGSPEVTTFFRKELRLAPTLVRWQRRTLQYRCNQCGHRFCEEGAVSETRQLDFMGSGERRGVELIFPACNVTEVMILAPSPGCVRVASSPEAGGGGVNTAPASQEDKSDGAHRPATSLSLQTSQQQQPPLQQKSPPLSLFEQEAIRTCERPWSGPPAKRFTQDT